MQPIRGNIFEVTHSELGRPTERGYYDIAGQLGAVLLDDADVRYIREYLDRGFEPVFFVKKTPALRGAFAVIARQRL